MHYERGAHEKVLALLPGSTQESEHSKWLHKPCRVGVPQVERNTANTKPLPLWGLKNREESHGYITPPHQAPFQIW